MIRKLTLAAAMSLAAFAVAAQEPRQGGTLRFTAPYGSSFASLDVHSTNRIQDDIWSKALHRTLYNWDSAANEPVPELIEEVTVADDGVTYTMKLRQDAYFHHGRQMTADDVIFTFTRIMDGAQAYPPARHVRLIEGAVAVERGEAEEISGLRKIDDFTIEMVLVDRLDPGFSFYHGNTSIYPADMAEIPNFDTAPVGLGPYRFVEYIPGSRLVGERWEQFYKEGKPYTDRIEILIMGEAAARDVAFRNGEIDVSVLGPVQYVAYQNEAALADNLLEVAEIFTRNMGMNPNFEPFSDPRVRQAINHAINSDLIIERLVRNKAFRATSWLPIGSPAYDDDLEPYAFDQDRARELLAEAGYPDGFSFEWTATANESWGIAIVEAVLPMLAQVGIEVNIVPVEGAVLSEVVRAGDFQAYIWSNTSGPDPLQTLKCYHSSTPQSACNYVQYNNPEFDALLDAAGATADTDERIDLLKQANRMLYDDAVVWFFNYNKAVMAYQPWVHGIQPNATELAIQYYEDIWIDETSPAAN
ncbi:MAG: ABC transporter substrate-binding protein [Gemmobacter sp.]